MKRNRVLKHLFLLAIPSIISIASVSCSSPTTPPQKDGDSQGTPGSETTPPVNNGEEPQPQPEPQPEPEKPTKTNPNQVDKKDEGNPNLGTGSTPSLSSPFQQLKAEIQKLSLYKDNFTKEYYDQYFKNLKEQKDSFINSKYTADQFDKDVTRLEKYYSQAMELLEILKTKGDAEVQAYLDSLKSQGDSIFKVENGVASINVLEINSLQSKLNSQNAKKVEEKQNTTEPETNPKAPSTSETVPKKDEGEQQPKVDSQKNLKDEYVKKLKGQLEELVFYQSGRTKEKYEEFINKYTEKEQKFVDAKNLYKKTKFKLDVWNLKYLYAQVAELEKQFEESVSYDTLLKYIQEEQQKANNIFIKASDENLPSIDYQKLNGVVFKLNAQAIVKNSSTT
ncbi:hypothetical protein NPA08_01830 [Mycoplasmopsis citelli]|uniref:hypothetical protein n=1 Tax=Mycoplasmopsis citelli TaxID=171281 RepID=UPI002113DCCB|nr:hypothetical protein [Mycoplasmopsis citelli]UUD36552.1 hypothetical protein NPA08_01830 [Mycoplasmopsis citelli]